ncbi:MAG: phosphoglycerate kinase [Pseudomonadota bacterium]
MSWKTLDEMELSGKVVLTRVDINVPVEDGAVSDATRIERIKPTIDAILKAGGKPVLLAHFGRPKGKVVPEMSLEITRQTLSDVLERQVAFAHDCVGEVAQTAVDALETGQVLLLENTRFHPCEEGNKPDFAQDLADLGDVYCNDAFSAAHRAHASTEAIAHLLPSCAGKLMEAELKALEAALSAPEHPVVAVVGGAKVSTKLELLGNLISKVDSVVIGGGMANTFLAAQGHDVGKSLCEHDLADTAREIMTKAEAAGCALVLPTDVVVAREFKAGAASETVGAEACPADAMILDAGPESVARITEVFAASRTLVWNGPLGAFEIPPFNAATDAAAEAAAALTAEGKLLSVAGGGDTVAALNGSGAAARFSYVSTAGGAFLEWLEGKTLPGVAALG